MEILTLGHSSLAWEAFLQLLKELRVEIVADVRRFPTSRKHPRFSREQLEAALQAQGLRYVWLGKELGGFRTGGYSAYMQTAEFRHGVQRLLELAQQGRTAILCAERDPRGCHRRFIASELVRCGVRVLHVLGPERMEEHPSPLEGL